MGRKSFAALVLLALAILAPQGSNAQPQESDPRGAVLCIWMIYASLHAIGQSCVAEADRDFLALLDSKIDDMDAFIIRNSDTTQTVIDARRKRISDRQLEMGAKACEPQSESSRLYTQFKATGSARINADISKLLEVERKPLANPCL